MVCNGIVKDAVCLSARAWPRVAERQAATLPASPCHPAGLFFPGVGRERSAASEWRVCLGDLPLSGAGVRNSTVRQDWPLESRPRLWSPHAPSFLQLAAVAVGLVLPASTRAEQEFDIVVYGGTSGGISAAVQAARLGKTVVLIEPGKHLGG